MFFTRFKKIKIIFISILVISFSCLSSCSCGCSKYGKSYSIGIDPSFYPLGLGSLQDNTYGFMQELLLEMAEEMHIRFFLVKANWDNLFDGLKEDKYAAIFSAKYPYRFEKDRFNFSDLILETGPTLIVKKEEKSLSLKEMQGKLIGYIQGDDSIFILEKYPEIIIKTYESDYDLLSDINSGFLDGGVLDAIKANSFIKNRYHNQLQLKENLNDEGLRLISPKGQGEIMTIFNKGLEKLQKKGTINKLKRKWNLS